MYFLRGVAEIGMEAVERSGRLLALRERFRKKVAQLPRALKLLDFLMINPYVTVARAEKLLGVSNPTAREAVNRLQAAGLLEETTGRSWGKLYLAKPILRVIDVDFRHEE
jgi:Fic family protein